MRKIVSVVTFFSIVYKLSNSDKFNNNNDDGCNGFVSCVFAF